MKWSRRKKREPVVTPVPHAFSPLAVSLGYEEDPGPTHMFMVDGVLSEKGADGEWVPVKTYSLSEFIKEIRDGGPKKD